MTDHRFDIDLELQYDIKQKALPGGRAFVLRGGRDSNPRYARTHTRLADA